VNNNNNNTHDRILLVDDEPDITTVFTLGLEDNGYRVDAFNDPVLALSNFRPNFYSLSII
jgi:DNA-binding response OmpR family regulator